MQSIDLTVGGLGLGWRQPHYRELLETRPALDFLEVHSENFFAEGGPALATLEAGRSAYGISLHGVGLALGSAAGIDEQHLARLAALVRRIEPLRVSDHACFARVAAPGGGSVLHLNDLLPVAFTPASLDILCDNVGRVQDRLRRPILVENLASYLRWADDALPEPAFFNALARRSGCGLLLDLNNLVVNALNAGREPVSSACAYVDALDAAAVGEIHLAGHDASGPLVIDDHGHAVPDSVWQVCRHALARLPAVPLLIERDNAIPPLPELLAELETARQLRSAVAAPAVSSGAAPR